MKKFKSLIVSVLAFAPALAFAQFNAGYFSNFLLQIKTVLGNVVPVLITLAIVVFFWELIMFIKNKNGGDAAKTKVAYHGLIMSLVAIFVMLSFLGIVRIFQGITGTTNPGNITQQDVPTVF